MARWITEAGFKDVTEKRYNWPVGPWSSDPKLKEIGKWNQYHWEEGLEGWSMALLTRVMGVSYHCVSTFGRDSADDIWSGRMSKFSYGVLT